MTKYKTAATPDLITAIDDLKKRISVLERTPQGPNTSVSGSGGSFYRVVSGNQIPSEITGFYNFFGRTVYVASIWSRGDPDSYIYEALTAASGSDTNSVLKSSGAVTDGGLRHHYEQAFGGKENFWFGNFGDMDLVVGTSIFGASNLIMQSAGLYLQGFPSNRTWMTQFYSKATASADLTLSTTPTNITGAMVQDVFLTRASTIEITGIFDFEMTVAGTTVGIGDLVVDGGAVQTPKARFGMAATSDRATVIQQWTVALPGSDFVGRSFQLKGSKSAAAGTAIIRADSTNITIKSLTQ